MEMDVLGNARLCKHGSDAGTTRNHALIYYMHTFSKVPNLCYGQAKQTGL
jgi:hypothetical protein